MGIYRVVFIIYLHGSQSISEKTFLQNIGGYGKINAEHLFYDYNLAHTQIIDLLRAYKTIIP